MIKKTFGIILAASLVVSTFATTVHADTQNIDLTPIRLVIDATQLTNLPMQPVLLNGSTLVPAREVFEHVGAVVDWKPETQEIYVVHNDNALVLQIDNFYANFNGSTMQMAVPPQIINGKTMIPLRFVSETFGFKVDWNGDERLVTIETNDEEQAPALMPELDQATLDFINETNATANAQTTPQENIPLLDDTLPQATQPQPTQTPIAQTANHEAPFVSAKDVSKGDIATVKAAKTNIKTINTQNETSGTFEVEATSTISKVSKFLLPDNRLVIDIYEAHMDLTKTEYATTSPYVSKIRVAQNATTPIEITRVVFDLNSGAEFNVSISEDRKSVKVSFEKNVVTAIDFKTEGASDVLTVTFKNTPSANVYPLTGPDKIVVDVPNATTEVFLDAIKQGNFTTAIRSAQFDTNMARIALDIQKNVMFTTKIVGNKLIVTLVEPTYKNIAYDANSKTLQIKKNGNINANTFTTIDQYNNLTYTVNTQTDLSNQIGYGEIFLNDIYLSSIAIANNANGQTVFTFKENRILAYNITEDAENVYIKVMLPKEKYDKILVLDAGHGGTDHGTMGNNLSEKNLNFDIANRVATLLEAEGSVKVYRTRTVDVQVQLEYRPVYANEIKGDLFVSIHNNSADKATKVSGTESFYYPHDNDATVGITSKEVADIMQSSLISNLGSLDRKVKQVDYYVLKYTKMPATLLEVGFVSNPTEAAKLATEEYRQKAADAIFQGVLTVFEQYNPAR